MSTPFALDPALLAAMDDLGLVAHTVVEGYLSGLHQSPFLGYSTEFAAYRPYLPGDNLRYVDWKVWGRTDKLYIKQFEDDTNLTCQILLDTSPSMNFGASNKLLCGRILAAALAYLMTRQHDATGLTLFNQSRCQALPARDGQRHLEDLFLAISNEGSQPKRGWSSASSQDKHAAPLSEPLLEHKLNQVLETFHRRGLTVILSDLFMPEEALLDLFRQLHFRRQEILVFHLLAAEELDFNYEGECLFQDSETGEEIPLHAGAYRGEYARRVAAFQKRIKEACEAYEVDYQRLRTDAPLAEALSAYLERRMGL